MDGDTSPALFGAQADPPMASTALKQEGRDKGRDKGRPAEMPALLQARQVSSPGNTATERQG